MPNAAAPAASAVPPWTLAVGAMLSVQLGSALSVPLIDTVGAAGTAWLRLSFGALVFLVIARPPLRSIRRVDLPALIGLGVISGLVTICFLAAIDRIPLGTAVAIEFLGPLTVAAIRSHSTRALVWPGLALVGVLGLTEPWKGSIDLAGLTFAALGAIGWAGNIVLTQHVGDRFTGVTALSITVPIAAATAAVVGAPQAAGHLSLKVVLTAAGLALLFPVLQYALDMLALRRMTPTAFGTLMALEPAIGIALGLVVLSQHPSAIQLGSIALVVLAGAGAQRGGRRPVSTTTTSTTTRQEHVLHPAHTAEPT
jgi:inner membrane transporter RhtA